MTPESKGLPTSNLAVNLAEDRPETAKLFLSNSELESATLSSCVSAQVSYCVMAINADRSSTSGAPAAERCHRDSKANKQQLGFHCDRQWSTCFGQQQRRAAGSDPCGSER